jgi:UDP-3-O-[3-hydroxymyristoyl] glucosamine N-acyltransferase
MTVDGDVSMNSKFYLFDDASLNSSLVGIGGNVIIRKELLVDGKTTLNSDLSLNGSIVIHGNIIPSIANTFTLGSADKPFNSLYVNLKTIFFTGGVNSAALSFNETTGGVDIANGGNTVSSVNSKNGRVAIGKLDPDYDLDVNGNVNISETLFVGSDVSLGAKLYVVNDASLNSKLFVGSDVSLGSKLYVVNDASLNSKLFVGSDVSLGSKLYVVNDASLNSKLFVGSDVSLGAKLYVVNDASLNSNLFVGSDVSLGAKLYLTGDASLNSKLFVGSDVSLGSKLYLTGDASLNSKLFVGSDVSLGAKLYVVNDASLNSKLFVGSDVSLGAKLYVVNDASLNSKLFVGSDVSLGAKLYVVNDASLNSKLFVGSDVSLGSNLFLTLDASFNRKLFLGHDASLGAKLYVVGDASLNSKLFVGSDVSLGSKLYLTGDASLNNKLFVGHDVSLGSKLYLTGDASLNSRLFVGSDVSFGSKLCVGGNIGIGAGTENTAYKLDVCGNMRIFESVGTVASATAGSLIFEHADASGVSSIMFKSRNAANDYAYIQYEENGGLGLQANGSEKGVLTIGIENDPTLATVDDVISLFPAGGQGFVGINTKDPLRSLDVNGGMTVSGDASLNSSVFINRLTTSFTTFNTTPFTIASVLTMTSNYLYTGVNTTAITINLPTIPLGVDTYRITIRRTLVVLIQQANSGNTTFTSTNTIFPSNKTLYILYGGSTGNLPGPAAGTTVVYASSTKGFQATDFTFIGVNNGTTVGWYEV